MTANPDATAWYAQTSSTQTMRTWARVIGAPEELPNTFRGVVPTDIQPFPYTLHLPEDRFALFGKRREKLLCVFADRLALHEARGDQVVTIAGAFDDVVCVVRGTVLLNSWLTIRARSGSMELKFNTTNLEYFEPVIAALRAKLPESASRADAAEHQAELAKFDRFSATHYKYMNYGRHSVRVGDPVLGMAYQPERCLRPGIALFGTTFLRRYATSHLAILTAHELILINEANAVRYDQRPLYGGVFTHIPRARIAALTFVSSPDPAVSRMNIALPDTLPISVEFATENASFAAFRQLCQTAFP